MDELTKEELDEERESLESARKHAERGVKIAELMIAAIDNLLFIRSTAEVKKGLGII